MERDQNRIVSTRRSLKRKLDQEFQEEQDQRQQPSDRKIPSIAPHDTLKDLLSEVRSFVGILGSADADRADIKRATHALCELAKNGTGFVLMEME